MSTLDPNNTSAQAPAVTYPRDNARHVSTPANRFRRQLLKGTVGTAVGAALAYFGWTRFLFPPAAPIPKAAANGTPGLKLGPVSEFLPGTPPKLVTLTVPHSDQTASYFVENLGSGQFSVLSPICTHLGCTVGWDNKVSQFACPCHGAHFDMTGKNISGPAPRPLSPANHQVVGDTLYLVA